MTISRLVGEPVLIKLVSQASNEMTHAAGGVDMGDSLWVCTGMTFKKISNIAESPLTTKCVFTLKEEVETSRECVALEVSTKKNSQNRGGAREWIFKSAAKILKDAKDRRSSASSASPASPAPSASPGPSATSATSAPSASPLDKEKAGSSRSLGVLGENRDTRPKTQRKTPVKTPQECEGSPPESPADPPGKEFIDYMPGTSGTGAGTAPESTFSKNLSIFKNLSEKSTDQHTKRCDILGPNLEPVTADNPRGKNKKDPK